jgi:ribosomal protein L29
MDKNELKKADIKKLEESVAAWKKELFDLKLTAASSHVKDSSQFKKLRLSVARALTYIREKKQKS